MLDIEIWILRALFYGLLVLRVWALADCLARKNAAFPAAGKLTKPAWALLNVFSVGIAILLHRSTLVDTPSLLALVTLVVTLVYLADVRPAVREVSGGSRW